MLGVHSDAALARCAGGLPRGALLTLLQGIDVSRLPEERVRELLAATANAYRTLVFMLPTRTRVTVGPGLLGIEVNGCQHPKSFMKQALAVDRPRPPDGMGL